MPHPQCRLTGRLLKRLHPLAILGATLVLMSGCEVRPKRTYQSQRRILALELWETNQTGVTTKYLLTTQDPFVRGGHVGFYEGDFTAQTVASNAVEWRLLLTFKGTNTNGTAVSLMKELKVPYPRFSQAELVGVGTVTGWFLSDEELMKFDRQEW
jgi:hypothetical protein